jgi:dihydrofolate reductase
MQWMVREYADALPSHARAHLGVAEAPLTTFDTIVMGRRTYDPGLALGITSPYAHLRQYVFSRTLEPLDAAVTVIDGDPVDAVRALKREDSELGIYLAGGGMLAGQLVGEIDRLVIKRYPVIAGAGKAAFGPEFRPTTFALDEVLTFDGGNVVEVYSRTTTTPEASGAGE